MESNWISVSSKKPPKAKPILLCNGNWICIGYYRKNYKLKTINEPQWSEENGEYIFNEPTHWQPLPKMPSEQNDEVIATQQTMP
jgi:hypothetical protein